MAFEDVLLLTLVVSYGLLEKMTQVLPRILARNTGNYTYASSVVKHGNAGGIIGYVKSELLDNVHVYNDKRIVGSDSRNHLTGGTTWNANDLDHIRGQLYHLNGIPAWDGGSWGICGRKRKLVSSHLLTTVSKAYFITCCKHWYSLSSATRTALISSVSTTLAAVSSNGSPTTKSDDIEIPLPAPTRSRWRDFRTKKRKTK
eukprot:gb/GECG01001239.1/.p1 GENE.gb/GECG01001239.1/~~gb/GECG01001239.1/.p1  ORF type:complete len:201 (+),score=14.87 gb/GECG01001239.1/:1-603(+)